MPDHLESYTLPSWPLIRWLTDVGPDVPADVRARLIAGFFTSTMPLVFGAVSNIAVTTVAAIRHPTDVFIALLAVDVVFLIGRLLLITTSNRAVRQDRRALTDALLFSGLLWAGVVGVGTTACLASGDPVLLFLGPSTTLGVIAGLVARNSGAPRLAIMQIIFCALPMSLTFPFLGQPWMLLGSVQSVFLVIGMKSAVYRLSQNYLAALMAEKDSKRRANHDALTGVLNRAGVMSVLSRNLRRATRQGNTLAVFYLDLDGFKAVNDGFGHGAGDDLLAQAAKRIGTNLPETWILGRLGGDEFVVIAPGCDTGQAAAIGGDVVAAVGLPFHLGTGVKVEVGVSIGIAFAAPETTAEELLAEADAALYRAKTEGKGRCLMASGRRAADRLAA